jgi:MFS family permease
MGTLSIRYTERLVMRFGARNALLSGLPLIAVALALLARVPLHGTYFADVFPSMTLLGIGAGLAFPALMTVAMSGATPQDAGLASGLVNTTAQVGGALGLAVLATLSASRTHALTRAGEQTTAALTGGYHLAFWIAAALVLASIAVAALALPRRAQQPAEMGAEDVPLGGAAEPAESRAA